MLASTLRHHLVGGGKGGNHDDMVAQQSKDAIIYVTVSTCKHTLWEKVFDKGILCDIKLIMSYKMNKKLRYEEKVDMSYVCPQVEWYSTSYLLCNLHHNVSVFLNEGSALVNEFVSIDTFQRNYI